LCDFGGRIVIQVGFSITTAWLKEGLVTAVEKKHSFSYNPALATYLQGKAAKNSG
jgi:hypothetical protein